MAHWIVKCREHIPGREGWSWEWYFDGSDKDYRKRPHLWGGHDWIRSNWSRKIIKSDIKQDDVVICYQSEGRRIFGLTRLADGGVEDPPRSGDYCAIKLAPITKALRFNPPIEADALIAAGAVAKWLAGGQGTIFPVDDAEFTSIMTAVKRLDPTTAKDIKQWLTTGEHGKLPTNNRVRDLIVAPTRTGFNTDPIQREKVERAAINHITKLYRKLGWTVHSVERDRCAYDLHCTKGKKELHIEVKGAAGTAANFPITRNEWNRAGTDELFRLCLVTNALSPKRKCYEWTGQELRRDFKVEVIEYMARSSVELA